jgi:ATP/ADP translocase
MLVELQFYAAAASTGNTSPGFFAVWYVISGTAGLILQLTLASRLASRFGLTGALLLLPAATLAGGAAVAGVALMIVPALFRVSESAVRASVHQSSWEQVFLRYEREVRARIKVAVDGVVSRIAAGFIALALTVAVWLRGPDVLASALGLGLGLTLVSILWLVMTARLRREGVAAPPPGLFVAAPPPDS